MSLFKREINNCIQKEWTKEWHKNPTCRMTKILYPNPDRRKAKQLLNLSRKKSRRLIEAITEHNNLHYIQNKIKKTDHLCRLCEEDKETFDHFVNDCPCLRQARQVQFGLNRIEKSHLWNIKGILQCSTIKEIGLAIRGRTVTSVQTKKGPTHRCKISVTQIDPKQEAIHVVMAGGCREWVRPSDA